MGGKSNCRDAQGITCPASNTNEGDIETISPSQNVELCDVPPTWMRRERRGRRSDRRMDDASVHSQDNHDDPRAAPYRARKTSNEHDFFHANYSCAAVYRMPCWCRCQWNARLRVLREYDAYAHRAGSRCDLHVEQPCDRNWLHACVRALYVYCSSYVLRKVLPSVLT